MAKAGVKIRDVIEGTRGLLTAHGRPAEIATSPDGSQIDELDVLLEARTLMRNVSRAAEGGIWQEAETPLLLPRRGIGSGDASWDRSVQMPRASASQYDEFGWGARGRNDGVEGTGVCRVD